MSRIIKGGKVKFVTFEYERAAEKEEELFNPLGTLLPQEEEEESAAPEGAETEVETLDEPADEEAAAEEEEPEEEFNLADIPLEELEQHPEVSEKLALLAQEAYEKGFEQGQKDGEALGRKKYETLASRLVDVLKSLEKEIENHVLSLEPQVLALVKLMAEQVINREITQGPEVLREAIREALSHVVDQARVKIRLNPGDLEFLEEILESLSEDLSRLRDFEVVPDAGVSRGGCLLETDFGLIDATIERRWREALQKLET
ncbi:MAG: hypothetical protein GXO17_01905 [Thermodesulfobacteria bacterium]|nr:hypothetical protein [Thermodesulfobacteriota bacterium]